MVITDFNLLGYLHDAKVLEVIYDAKDNDNRATTMTIRCDSDAGFPAWNGKLLSIRLGSIVLLSFSAFGAVTGPEQINSWDTTLSVEMESELQRLQELGIDCSGIRFGIAFHSGSVLEGLCKQIVVEETSGPDAK